MQLRMWHVGLRGCALKVLSMGVCLGGGRQYVVSVSSGDAFLLLCCTSLKSQAWQDAGLIGKRQRHA
jgi:hypothetical protein